LLADAGRRYAKQLRGGQSGVAGTDVRLGCEWDDLPGNGVLTLSSVRGTLNTALEPASVTLLLTGFVGVSITRRWRRRSCAGAGVAGGIPG
jgi:hypothetical protein